jgi:integrative and conjugative element protein (TIGR02256 family)
LAESVLRTIGDEATRQFPLETGGVLVGYCSPDWSRVVVTAVSGPGHGAIHARSRFNPDAEFQAEFVAKSYRDSGRIWQYLGDWHCHPSGVAKPSWIDRRTLCNIAKDPLARTRKPLMLIAAGQPRAWQLSAWQLQGSGIWPRLRTAELIID